MTAKIPHFGSSVPLPVTNQPGLAGKKPLNRAGTGFE
jgi:hypothetical protein